MAREPVSILRAPPGSSDPHLRAAIAKANQVLSGRLNNIDEFTLTANTTTTTVSDHRVKASSVILLMPVTANAALEFAGMLNIDSGAPYCSTITNRSFTVTHSNHVSTDRTFRYALFG